MHAISYDIVHLEALGGKCTYRTISYDTDFFLTKGGLRQRAISCDISLLIFGSVGYNIVRYRTILDTISYDIVRDALGCT